VSNHFIDYVAVDADTFKPYHLLVSLFRLLITKGYFIAIIPTLLLIVAWRKKNYLWVEAVNNFFLPLVFFLC
jgi:general stress protein CsbA